jgi:hypothetical protein
MPAHERTPRTSPCFICLVRTAPSGGGRLVDIPINKNARGSAYRRSESAPVGTEGSLRMGGGLIDAQGRWL